ncbi:MAG: phage head-tail joining family protein [Hyphomicrobiales bacterium]|nr:phage head-tail joining family protein [Hyphomicrobiales bacterium]
MSAGSVGRLRQRLVAEEPVDADDEAGGATRTFAARFEVWAEIDTQRTQPDFMAAREETVVTHRIRLRAGNAVAAGWRLRKGTRVFDVVSCAPDDVSGGFCSYRCREIV